MSEAYLYVSICPHAMAVTISEEVMPTRNNPTVGLEVQTSTQTLHCRTVAIGIFSADVVVFQR
jgi:hypothetical protein